MEENKIRLEFNVARVTPEGYQIDKENSTLENIVFEKKKKKTIFGHIHKGSVDKQSRLYYTGNLTPKYYNIEQLGDWKSTPSATSFMDVPEGYVGGLNSLNKADYVSTPKDAGGETRREVKTFEVDYTCTECKEGKMRHTGATYFTNPLKYLHKCTKCGHTETFSNKTYPYIEYV